MPEHRVVFLPHKKSGCFEAGTILRDAALDLGILIDSTCAGIGTCARCKVIVKSGGSQVTEIETELLSAAELKKGVRLACRAAVTGDVLCLVPEDSQPSDGRFLTAGASGRASLHPDIRKISFQLRPHQLGEKYFIFSEIAETVQRAGVAVDRADLAVVQAVSRMEFNEGGAFTAVVDGPALLAVEAGDTTGTLFGVALDIGTTTVAAKLVDLTTGEVQAVAAAANPQAAHGADVISRLRYIVDHPGGLKRLHRIIIAQINGMIEHLCRQGEIRPENIYKLTLAGNTVMQHVALNIDPRGLASRPYTPAFQGPLVVRAHELNLNINRAGVVYTVPNLACFVGGDITSVLSVLDIENQDRWQLVIDMGTNGEIVLGSKRGVLCCSSPAGPAWEGACITWGMRATRGAIERAEIVDGDLNLRVIGETEPSGICGSGLIDLVCEFLRAGMIEKSGRIPPPDALPESVSGKLAARVSRQENGAREIMIAPLAPVRQLALSQNDIREVQLAKSAIAAGVRLLMQEAGISADSIERVYIAGAFGNHIRGQDVVDLGMLPGIAPEKIEFIGNAALSGAEAILRSRRTRQKAENLAQQADYIEIAGRPEFQDCFVDSMHFAIGK